MIFSRYLILRFNIFLLIQIATVSLYANNNDIQLLNDTAKINGDTIHLIGIISYKEKLEALMDDSIETELLDSGNVYLKTDIKENALLHFIESDKFKNDAHNKKVIKRIYGKLAKIFAKKNTIPLQCNIIIKRLLIISGKIILPIQIKTMHWLLASLILQTATLSITR